MRPKSIVKVKIFEEDYHLIKEIRVLIREKLCARRTRRSQPRLSQWFPSTPGIMHVALLALKKKSEEALKA